MYIEQYKAQISNLTTKQIKNIKVDANTVYEAHKKALKHSNHITEEITKIENSSGAIVFTFNDGFLE
jgi:ferritin